MRVRRVVTVIENRERLLRVLLVSKGLGDLHSNSDQIPTCLIWGLIFSSRFETIARLSFTENA